MNEHFATIKAEPKRVMILEPNPDFSPWLKTWPTTLELTADKQLPLWIKDLFGLDERRGEYTPTPPHSEFEEYMNRLQGVDRFARHRDETIPNPLYLELFE